MLRKIWQDGRRALRFGVCMAKAQDLAAQGEGLRALQLLDEIYSDLGAIPAPVECSLLRAKIAAEFGDRRLALASAREALDKLQRGRGRFNAAERGYLILYATVLIEDCQSGSPPTAGRRGVELRSQDLKRVRAHLSASFPLARPTGSL